MDLHDENDDVYDVSLKTIKGPVPGDVGFDLNKPMQGPFSEEGSETLGFVVALEIHTHHERVYDDLNFMANVDTRGTV